MISGQIDLAVWGSDDRSRMLLHPLSVEYANLVAISVVAVRHNTYYNHVITVIQKHC